MSAVQPDATILLNAIQVYIKNGAKMSDEQRERAEKFIGLGFAAIYVIAVKSLLSGAPTNDNN